MSRKHNTKHLSRGKNERYKAKLQDRSPTMPNPILSDRKPASGVKR
jgi:hypothetical protein